MGTAVHGQVREGAPIRLLDVEPELGDGVPPEEHALLRRATVTRALALEPGLCALRDPAALGDGPFALLIVDGLVTRSVALADRSAGQLLGPGELIAPWNELDSLVPTLTEWRVNTPTVAAVLDARLLTAARRWPSIFRLLLQRQTCQAERLAVHVAISQLPRVDTRVLALLWHLADRFGRVGRAGVVVPLKLTHEVLGHLIGAQRPTVSIALRDLAERGMLERAEGGGWLLREGSQDELAADPEVGVIPAIARIPVPDDPSSVATTPSGTAARGDGADADAAARRLLDHARELKQQGDRLRAALGDGRCARDDVAR